MPRTEETRASAPYLFDWVGWGAWVGLLLAAARVAVLVAMALLAHAEDQSLVRIRVANELPGLLGAALVAGVVGAGVLWLAGRNARGGWGAILGRGVAWVAIGLAFALLLTGRWGGAGETVGWETPRGRQANVIALAVALILGTLLLVGVERIRGLPATRRPLRRLWPPALLALGLLAGAQLVARLPERVVVRVATRELLLEDWEVRAAQPEHAPSVRNLCPSLGRKLDGAGMPALSLPPPARVRLIASTGGEPLWLAARAGIDRSAWTAGKRRHAGHAVRFVVSVAGEPAFDRTLPIVEESEWVDVGGAEGVLVRDGDVIELATTLVDPGGDEVTSSTPPIAGFGGLTLERRSYRARTRASPDAPNVVLIVIDTLRRDRLSLYGYGRATTPNIDALARRGLVFDDAYSTSGWTKPSTASILTGMQPQEHGVLDSASTFLSEMLETLPEALQGAGFTTAAWTANPLIVPQRNFDQGFELFDSPRDGRMRGSREIMPAVLDWLAAAAEWRFFLYLHLVDPHAPLLPTGEGRRRFAADVPEDFDPHALKEYGSALKRGAGRTADGEIDLELCVPADHQRWIGDLYDACVFSADHWVGQVVEELESLGLAEETVVVVTSDHGEELFDHGAAGHVHSLHREVTGVPLILAGPGVPRGVRVGVPISNRHLAPTLARLGGAEIGPGDGRDLLDPGGHSAGGVLFSTRLGWWNGHSKQPLFGLREGPLVLHYAPSGSDWNAAEPDPEGQWRLFDLESDPTEQRDLASSDPSRADALRATLERRLQELRTRRRTLELEADPATVEMLRALGYAGDE